MTMPMTIIGWEHKILITFLHWHSVVLQGRLLYNWFEETLGWWRKTLAGQIGPGMAHDFIILSFRQPHQHSALPPHFGWNSTEGKHLPPHTFDFQKSELWGIFSTLLACFQNAFRIFEERMFFQLYLASRVRGVRLIVVQKPPHSSLLLPKCASQSGRCGILWQVLRKWCSSCCERRDMSALDSSLSPSPSCPPAKSVSSSIHGKDSLAYPSIQS